MAVKTDKAIGNIDLVNLFQACSCHYKTDHSAAANSRINSLGDFSFNPL